MINCKVDLKFKWTKYCVLPATGVDNIDDNIMIMVMVTILFFLWKTQTCVLLLQPRYNQKLSKILSDGFERSVYWNELKTKSENKTATNECRCFIESILSWVNILFALVYLNRDNDL